MSWKLLTTRKGRKPRFGGVSIVHKNKKKSVAQKVNRLLRASETKSFTTTTAPFNTDDSPNGGITLVNGVQNGDLGCQREGKKITMKSLRIQGTMRAPDAPTSFVSDFVVVTVIVTRKPLGVALTNKQLIYAQQDMTAPGTQTYSYYGGNMMLNNNISPDGAPKQYKVLYEKVITLSGPNPTLDVGGGAIIGRGNVNQRMFSATIPLKNMPCIWTDASTALGSVPQINSLYVLITAPATTAGAGAGDKPIVQHWTRLRFSDA